MGIGLTFRNQGGNAPGGRNKNILRRSRTGVILCFSAQTTARAGICSANRRGATATAARDIAAENGELRKNNLNESGEPPSNFNFKIEWCLILKF